MAQDVLSLSPAPPASERASAQVENVVEALENKSKVHNPWIWDDGFDFSFLTYMDWMEGNRPIDHMKVIASVNSGVGPIGPDPWHKVKTAGELAEAIHEAAIEK